MARTGATSEQTLEKEAALAEKTTKALLDEMPKVKIIIPHDPQNPSDKVVPVGCNGVTYAIPRGVQVEVPQVIADIWNDSYSRTVAANNRIEESVDKEVKVM